MLSWLTNIQKNTIKKFASRLRPNLLDIQIVEDRILYITWIILTKELITKEKQY
jgi:hypothetical protein